MSEGTKQGTRSDIRGAPISERQRRHEELQEQQEREMIAALGYGQFSTSAAQPIGDCPHCGGQLYALLTHHCTSAVKVKPVQTNFKASS